MDNSMIASEGGEEPQPTLSDEQLAQLFCLRWNNYQSNLTHVFDQLLQNESFVDVTLACADGLTVKAHKMVLSACSPYFQTLFFENPCRHPIVILKDIKFTDLKAAVEFMYRGEINVCQDQIGPLLKVAESLKIRGLADVNNDQDFSQSRDTKSPTSSGTTTTSVAETAARSPSRPSGNGQPPSRKRRRTSADRSSTSTGEDTISAINSPSRALELVTSPSSSVGGGANAGANCNASSGASSSNQQNQAGRPSQSSTPQSPSNMSLPIPPPPSLPGTSSVDDMEIKPGIAEMIREEERAKMLESSQAWLNASTSLAYHGPSSSRMSSAHTSGTGSLKLKVPTWTQSQLREAMQAVINQRMRFTQASTYYCIPKGTLYDNILGKTRRMKVLEEAGLTNEEEERVLEYCCDISQSPYNRRTRKALKDILTFVRNMNRTQDSGFVFHGKSGFKWWWAFCKKHSVVSLYYSGMKNNAVEDDTDCDDEPFDFSMGRGAIEAPGPSRTDRTNACTLPSVQQYLKLSVESSFAPFNQGNVGEDGAVDFSTFSQSNSSVDEAAVNFSAIQGILAKATPICH